MSAPGGILMAKIIMPDPKGQVLDEPDDVPVQSLDEERPANLIMAASQGAQTGVKLAVAVGAMVLAFVALVALANGFVGWLFGLFGLDGVTFQSVIDFTVSTRAIITGRCRCPSGRG